LILSLNPTVNKSTTIIVLIDIDKVKVNKEYEGLVPSMDRQAFLAFVESIKAHGQEEPIEINSKNEILDGHHRFKACKLLGHTNVKAMRKSFANEIEERLYIRRINGQRRHLTKAQQIELALSDKPELEQLARLNESLGGKLRQKGNGKGVQNLTPLKRVNEVIAKNVGGVSAFQVHQMDTILKKGSDRLKDRVRHGDVKIDKAYKEIRNEIQRIEQIERSKNLSSAFLNNPNKCQLFEGDLEEVSRREIKESSISFIYTDPPYGREYLPSYAALVRVADRVLQVAA
jgi:ParB-like nuclease family protein